MSQASSPQTEDQPRARSGGRRRAIARVQSLDSLVGAHPDALRDLYAAGSAADPSKLQDEPPGRLLAVEHLSRVYMMSRPLVELVSRRLLPWKGKQFDPDGAQGSNRVARWQLWRFRCETAASELDGQPTLLLRYDGLSNPWPISHIVDELREVADEVFIGPASLRTNGRSRLLFWWGLSSSR